MDSVCFASDRANLAKGTVMVRQIVAAVAFALAVPATALACESHRQEKQALKEQAKVKLAQSEQPAPPDAKAEVKAEPKAALANEMAAQTGSNAQPQPAPAKKKAKPGARSMAQPKAAQ